MSGPARPIRVAVVVTTRSPYEEDILRGVLQYSDQAGPWQFARTGNIPFVVFDKVDLSRVDGVIGGFYDTAWATAVEQAGVRAVNTSNQFEQLPLPRVGPDDLAVGRMGGEYLLSRGFARFGFLTHGDSWFSAQRQAGFAEVIERQAGRTLNVFDPQGEYRADQIEPVRDWIDALPKPIAIMAANDHRGHHAILAATELGLRVPEDVAVLGVDNNEWVSALTPTPMSSIRMDGRRIGYRAAKVLDGLLADELPPPPQWILPTGVATRRSTDVVVADDPLVSRALRFIRDHCTEPIGVEDVLDAVGVSRKTLETRMKRAIGQTPQVAIFHARIDRAKVMLVNATTTIGEIGRACGFARPARFSIVFKRLTGMTPGQYRRDRPRP